MTLEVGVASAFLAQVLRISVPYALAATGGAFSERGGVINIALEGIILAGAFGTAAGALATGSPWLGLCLGVGAGVLIAGLHAAVTVGAKADQILSGLALNLLVLGGTRGLLRILYDSSSNSPRLEGFAPLGIVAHLSGNAAPPVGVPAGGVGAHVDGLLLLLGHPLFLLTVGGIVLAHLLLFGTGFGLSLRAAGDGPRALDGAGISVSRMRVAGVLLCGAFGGAAGAWLALEQHTFTDGMSGGRGYIALAAMIVGKWRPLAGAAVCLLFGAAETMQMRVSPEIFPTQFLQMLPYVVTILALAGWIGRSTAPARLGEPYDREEGR
jgi:general nucleoside transport system permease protein